MASVVQYPVALDLTEPERKLLMHSMNRALVLLDAMLVRPGNTMGRSFWLDRIDRLQAQVHNRAHPVTVLCQYDTELLVECVEGNTLMHDLSIQAMGDPGGTHNLIMSYGRATKTIAHKIAVGLGRAIEKRK